MNIVIADDDMISLDILREFLCAEGHSVEAVEGGEAALSALRMGRAQVLVTDWEMPVMDGPTLCRRVRSAGLGRYVFIVMLTSRSGQKNLVEGLEAGADDFLTKPFDPVELSVRLKVAERIVSLETRDLTIFALAKLAESRDPETGSHLERTRLYCRMLAEQLGKDPAFASVIDESFVSNIYQTSPLHDIGKVGIPDYVLLKPDRLDDREFAIMKTHTTVGAETLSAALAQCPSAGFLQMALDIAVSHHEKFDGSGYPHGIAGEKIPLAARIMAVADVYDALRSKRPYKNAFTHEVAKAIILQGSGTHFDPRVVDAFMRVESDFLGTQTRLEQAAA